MGAQETRLASLESFMNVVKEEFGLIYKSLDELIVTVTGMSNTLVKLENYNTIWRRNFRFVNGTVNRMKKKLNSCPCPKIVQVG